MTGTALVIAAMLVQAQPQAATPATPAPAKSDAAAMMAHYRELTSVAPSQTRPCGAAGSGDIVVCGSRHDDQRLPLPGERDTTSIGPSPEPERAEAMCEASSGRACAVCPPTGCTGVNLLAAPFKLFRIVRALVDPEH